MKSNKQILFSFNKKKLTIKKMRYKYLSLKTKNKKYKKYKVVK